MELWLQGCYEPLKRLYSRYTLILGGVAIGVALVELVGILAACCMVRAINKEKDNEHV